MKYDILILGTGPAGLSAAVTARSRGKQVLVVGNRWQDSGLAKAERVENYPGLPGVTGAQLLDSFSGHAARDGVEFAFGRVISAMAWDGFVLNAGSEMYQGSALILAPGVVPQKKWPGEAEFLGRGVSYCATCDGMLYRGKNVVVVGDTVQAAQEANYLRSIGCSVTFAAPKAPEGLDAEIPVVQAKTFAVEGEQTVTALMAEERRLPCDGVFFLRPQVAPDDLFPGLETKEGAICVDRAMQTNLTGVFAAGDCTGAPRQIAKAVGEGQVAALSACAYLDEKQRKE